LLSQGDCSFSARSFDLARPDVAPPPMFEYKNRWFILLVLQINQAKYRPSEQLNTE